jgi:hypothetical protein
MTFYQASLTDPSTFEGGVAVGVVVGLILLAVGATIALVRLLVKRRRPAAPLLAPPPTSIPAPVPPPQPELRILSVQSSGGGSGHIDFVAELANVGTQFSRCEVMARVGDKEVECNPSMVDLEPQKAPKLVRIMVARPGLGDLVSAFASEPTLYDRTLRVEAVDGEHRASSEWHEKVYSLEENPKRYHIQQRVWRIGRGEDTPDDRRGAELDEAVRRYREKHAQRDDDDLVDV